MQQHPRNYSEVPFKNGSQYVMLLDGGGYPIKYDNKQGMYLLNHNEEYSILIGNCHNTLKAVFNIEVDGTEIGKFQIKPNSARVLTRPRAIDRKFIFVSRESQLGMQGGLDKKSVSDLGVCTVEIRLEKPPVFHRRTPEYGCPSGSRQREIRQPVSRRGAAEQCVESFKLRYECDDYQVDGVGGTVLGGRSHQEYISVPPIDSETVGFFKIKMGLLRPEVVPLTASLSESVVDYEA